MPVQPPTEFEFNYYGTKRAVDAFRANLNDIYHDPDIVKTYRRETLAAETTREIYGLTVGYHVGILPYYINSLKPVRIYTPMDAKIHYDFITYNQAKPDFQPQVKVILSADPDLMGYALYRDSLKTLIQEADMSMVRQQFRKDAHPSRSGHWKGMTR